MWQTSVFGNLDALESARIEDVAFLALQSLFVGRIGNAGRMGSPDQQSEASKGLLWDARLGIVALLASAIAGGDNNVILRPAHVAVTMSQSRVVRYSLSACPILNDVVYSSVINVLNVLRTNRATGIQGIQRLFKAA